MHIIRASTAVGLSWLFISAGAFLSVALSLAAGVTSTLSGWPPIVSVVIGFATLLLSIVPFFMYVFPAWVAYLYLHVDDVEELQKASMIGGFGSYPVNDLKNTQKRELIKERFAQYKFVDDAAVPAQVQIYSRRLYQDAFFWAAVIVSSYIILASEDLALFILPALFLIFAWSRSNSFDRTPQIILDSEGIRAHTTFYCWTDISDYEVVGGKSAHLHVTVKGEKQSLDLDKLKVSFARLNHWLHVYSKRRK